MKRIFPAWALLAVGVVLLGAAAEQSLVINRFGGRLADYDPLALPEGMAQDSENVITDLGSGLEPREGYIRYATEPAKAMWVFAKSNGTRYTIAHSGNNLKADSGAKTYSTLVSTVAAGVVTAGAQLGDYFYFSNTVDGLKRWDGAAVSVASAPMTFDKLVTWKGRLVGAGKPSSERTIFLSRYLVGTDWTLETTPTDDGPSQITVGGALDENITGLFPGFKDLLIWFKNNSFGGLYGSRRSNFILRTFSESVGSNHPATAKDCDGFLRFLGPRRTVWEFDGSNLTKISEGNNALFDSIINGESNTQTATITSKSDFDAGTMVGLATGISSGDLMLSTWTATDTTADDFGAGALTNTTTSTVNGDLYIAKSNTNSESYSFESGGWPPMPQSSARAKDGTYSMLFRASDFGSCPTPASVTSVLFKLYNDSTGLAEYTSGQREPSSSGVWEQFTENISSYAGKRREIEVEVKITCNGGSLFTLAGRYSGPFGAGPLLSGSDMTWWAYKETISGAEVLYVDLFEGGVSTITSGSFTSRAFNTALSSPSWTPSAANLASNGNTISFTVQSSTDALTWSTPASWTPGAKPSVPFYPYLRYNVSFSMQSDAASTGWPYVSDVTFSGRQSSGTFVSDTRAIDTAISAWNVFQRDETLNDGTITYGFYTDTDTVKTIGSDGLPVVGTFTSSQTITNNTIPSLSTAAYAFVSAKFDITNSTQNPTVGRLSMTWNEGSDLKAKGIWTKQRYWLAASEANTTSNDTVFVFDRRRHWQKYTGFAIDDIITFNASPLFSNTTGIYQGETGTSDNGSSISSIYTTKYFFPSGPETRGFLRDLWMTTTNSDATLGTQLFYDGMSTPVTLGSFAMNEMAGYQVKKFPVPTGGPQMARHVAIRWAVTGTERWKVLNGSLYFDTDTVRE